jgi:ketosteroid isomerase-like protein
VAQELRSAGVVVVGETAVLHAEVSDTVDTGDGTTQTSVMPMTQVWVRDADGWRCLAGHAGPPRSPGS